MPRAYTDDQLVEQSAIGLFAPTRLVHGVSVRGDFRRDPHVAAKNNGRGVLVSRLRAALERLNVSRMGHHAMPPETITVAVDELTRHRSAISLEAAKREVYRSLKEGIKVSALDRERGGQKTKRVRVTDWEPSANHDFAACLLAA